MIIIYCNNHKCSQYLKIVFGATPQKYIVIKYNKPVNLPNVFGKLNFPHKHFVYGTSKGKPKSLEKITFLII